MARAGLSDGGSCVFANDFDPIKCETYCVNWGSGHFVDGDVGAAEGDQLPGEADFAWASFLCQDLSLAGEYKGLGSTRDNLKTRSGAFWLFHERMKALREQAHCRRH